MLRASRGKIVGVICGSSLLLAGMPSQAGQSSTVSAVVVGRAFVNSEIARYGVVTNAAWDKSVSTVLGRLQRASGYPDLRIRYVMLRNPAVNAEAVPGGSILVNAGLLGLLDTLAGNQFKNPAARHDQFNAYLAAVLAHELAHLTLGHTDSLAARVGRFAIPAVESDSQGTPSLAFQRMVQDSGPTLEELQHSRERELEADRVGSLYLLRAGWTIQTAMDLMRSMDSLERRDPSFAKTVTYVQTHPRASMREASLEAFRAQLKTLQADYDDALALIQNNVAVPSAITLLDTILVYFPGMTPALHARGTAYHQLWLETVPVPTQRVRASLITYSFRFLPLIRGASGDMSLFASAQANYRAALSSSPASSTQVQLAMLAAYAGDCTKAIDLALAASLSDSLAPDVANNRGVVLFLCNQPAAAARSFQRAQQLAGPHVVPSLLFNTGRALKETGDAAGDGNLRRYLQLDGNSQWAAEARTLVGEPGNSGNDGTTSGSASGSPSIQGIRLGDPVVRVFAVWGSNSTPVGDSVTFVTYPQRGIEAALSRVDGIVLIGLVSRAAGSVDGVRVGDNWNVVRATWGTPVEQKQGFLLFSRNGYAIAAVSAGDHIKALAIMVRR